MRYAEVSERYGDVSPTTDNALRIYPMRRRASLVILILWLLPIAADAQQRPTEIKAAIAKLRDGTDAPFDVLYIETVPVGRASYFITSASETRSVHKRQTSASRMEHSCVPVTYGAGFSRPHTRRPYGR